MNANPVLLQKKYVRVIGEFANLARISLYEAMDLFYKSETYKLMSQGIADMHCLSDKYLAEELVIEYHYLSHPTSFSCT